MKWLVKGMIALVIGVGLWMMAPQSALACCCIQDDLDGSCKICVYCGNEDPKEEETTVTGFSACAGYPSGYKISCGKKTDPGFLCWGVQQRMTCQPKVPAKWAGSECDQCQLDCLCCPPGSSRQCDTVSDSTEYYEIARRTRDQMGCASKSDLYISQRPYSPANTHGCSTFYNAKGEEVERCYNVWIKCAKNMCSCRPDCSAPTKPTLVNPEDGADPGNKARFFASQKPVQNLCNVL